MIKEEPDYQEPDKKEVISTQETVYLFIFFDFHDFFPPLKKCDFIKDMCKFQKYFPTIVLRIL